MNDFNTINFINQYELQDFIEDINADTSETQNLITCNQFSVRKLRLNSVQKSNISLDYIKKLEHANNDYIINNKSSIVTVTMTEKTNIKILMKFIYKEYLVYFTECINMKEWEFLENYLKTNNKLTESKVKEIAIKIYNILFFFNQKDLFHLKLHPKNILINTNKGVDIKITNFHIEGTSDVNIKQLKKDFGYCQFYPPEVNILI